MNRDKKVEHKMLEFGKVQINTLGLGVMTSEVFTKTYKPFILDIKNALKEAKPYLKKEK